MTTQAQVRGVVSAPQVARQSLIPTHASPTPNPTPRKKDPPSSTTSPAPTEKHSMRIPPVDREEIVQRPVGILRKPLPGSGKTLWQNLRDSGVSVIAHSSNFDTLNLPFQCSMLDAFTLYEGLSRSETMYHAWVAVRQALDTERLQGMSVKSRAHGAMEFYRIELGAVMMDFIPGKHFTFVDPNLHDCTDRMVNQAVRLIRGFEKKGISRKRIVISIPATEAGVRAAKLLKEGVPHISTNLTHVSGFIHAAACVEAGADVITFCCKPLLTAYNALHALNMHETQPCDHPCIQGIQMTTEYFRLHKVRTEIAASNLCGSPSIAPLKGLNYIAVLDSDVQDIMEHGVPFNHSTADASPSLRARQAQHPTTHSGKNGEFLEVMSAETRSLAIASLMEGTYEAKKHTKKLFKHFCEEVERELLIRNIDTRGLVKMYELDVQVAQAITLAEHKGVPRAEIARFLQDAPEPRYGHLGFRLSMNWSLTSKNVSEHEAKAPVPQFDDHETRLLAEEVTGDPGHSTRSPIGEKPGKSADLGDVVRPPTPLSSVGSDTVARGEREDCAGFQRLEEPQDEVF